MAFDFDYATFCRMQISVLYCQARLRAIEEALARMVQPGQSQSLHRWLRDQVQAEVDLSLRDIETKDPAHAAILLQIRDDFLRTLDEQRKSVDGAE